MNNTFKIASLAFWFFAITLNLNSKQDFPTKALNRKQEREYRKEQELLKKELELLKKELELQKRELDNKKSFYQLEELKRKYGDPNDNRRKIWKLIEEKVYNDEYFYFPESKDGGGYRVDKVKTNDLTHKMKYEYLKKTYHVTPDEIKRNREELARYLMNNKIYITDQLKKEGVYNKLSGYEKKIRTYIPLIVKILQHNSKKAENETEKSRSRLLLDIVENPEYRRHVVTIIDAMKEDRRENPNLYRKNYEDK